MPQKKRPTEVDLKKRLPKEHRLRKMWQSFSMNRKSAGQTLALAGCEQPTKCSWSLWTLSDPDYPPPVLCSPPWSTLSASWSPPAPPPLLSASHGTSAPPPGPWTSLPRTYSWWNLRLVPSAPESWKGLTSSRPQAGLYSNSQMETFLHVEAMETCFNSVVGRYVTMCWFDVREGLYWSPARSDIYQKQHFNEGRISNSFSSCPVPVHYII